MFYFTLLSKTTIRLFCEDDREREFVINVLKENKFLQLAINDQFYYGGKIGKDLLNVTQTIFEKVRRMKKMDFDNPERETRIVFKTKWLL